MTELACGEAISYAVQQPATFGCSIELGTAKLKIAPVVKVASVRRQYVACGHHFYAAMLAQACCQRRLSRAQRAAQNEEVIYSYWLPLAAMARAQNCGRPTKFTVKFSSKGKFRFGGPSSEPQREAACRTPGRASRLLLSGRGRASPQAAWHRLRAATSAVGAGSSRWRAADPRMGTVQSPRYGLHSRCD